ncbi:MAG TPA: sensor domain-containing diguanylate cyclase [Solirubrobacteraceae bacterium]|nr:sensor domain-containing diguanylate cyclase [Solirubrobacteraceae bacterium]
MNSTTNLVASVRRLSQTEPLPTAGAVHDALAEELLMLLGVEAVHLQHLSDSGQPELAVSYTPGEHIVRRPYPVSRPGPDSGVAWVASTGRPLVAPQDSPLGPELVGRFQRAAAALLPLIVEGRVVAVIVLVSPEALDDSELELAGTLIELAATNLALIDARAAARTDSLTGLMNYGAMLGRLDEEIDRARRQGSALASLILDLDNFKLINDRYGHLIGDGILRQVASTLRHEFRRFDRVARYGGDEFVVILPNAEGNRAAVAGQRALRRLRDIRVEVAESQGHHVTASIGWAAWRPPDTAHDLLTKADEALRRMKTTGKDRLGGTNNDEPPPSGTPVIGDAP